MASTYCESFAQSGFQGIYFPMTVLSPIVIVTFLTMFFQLLFTPIGQVTFASQMLAGIALGPSFLGQNKRLSKQIFPAKTVIVLHVFEGLGFIFMLFSVFARMDKTIITKAGRLTIIIGLGFSVLPMLASVTLGFYMMDNFDKLDKDFRTSLPIVATLESSVCFPVTFTILADLKLLNSEIGRIALSSSFIGTITSWLGPPFVKSMQILKDGANKEQEETDYGLLAGYLVPYFSIPLVCALVFRPIMFWMMKRTPEGKSLKHGHVLVVKMMILFVAFCGEIFGLGSTYGPTVLAFCTPITSPMGHHLLEKIQYFVWAVFLPCFTINNGRHINLSKIRLDAVLVVSFLALVSKVVKLFAIIVPSLYYKIPFPDAVLLGLILNCQDIYDIQVFHFSMDNQIITEECFSIMLITATLYSIVLIPLLRVICNNSRKHTTYNALKIQNCIYHAEFRMLACIHEAENIPTLINVLQISNPPESPAGVYVMNLEEYCGRSLPLVIPHKLERVESFKPSRIDAIINAFHHYETQNMGFISVQCYTAVAPYASMHEDICSMAFEKCVVLVVIPFQKTNSHVIRKFIKNVLKISPCAVGIMYDHGVFLNFRPILSQQLVVNVCALFLGGPDDREALAYGERMVKNERIKLTVIRFIAVNHCTIDLVKEYQDENKISDFKISNIENKNVEYIEESVTEGTDTAKVLLSIGNDFDLILVGRRHDVQSQVLSGLGEWTEIEELGVVGDLLASSDFKGNASLMVIQQASNKVED